MPVRKPASTSQRFEALDMSLLPTALSLQIYAKLPAKLAHLQPARHVTLIPTGLASGMLLGVARAESNQLMRFTFSVDEGLLALHDAKSGFVACIQGSGASIREITAAGMRDGKYVDVLHARAFKLSSFGGGGCQRDDMSDVTNAEEGDSEAKAAVPEHGEIDLDATTEIVEQLFAAIEGRFFVKGGGSVVVRRAR